MKILCLKSNVLVKLYILCLILFLIALFTAYFYTDPASNVNNLNRNIRPDFFQIFFNNIKVASLLVFLGPLTLSLGTVAVLIINGLILGNAIGNIKDNLNLLLLVIPHGIIEVPVFASCSLCRNEINFGFITPQNKFKIHF